MKRASKAAHLMASYPSPSSRQQGRLRQNIRSTLLRWIVTGKLQAGESVNESRLATQLNVSRTPLREALLQLDREGFVRSDERRGFSVEHLSGREVREIYPMLWTLEGLAVRSSAVCVHLLVPELNRINSEFAKARSAQLALSLDTRWHQCLTSQSQNRRLLATISGLRLGIHRYESIYMADTRLLSESTKQHKAIIVALKERDVTAAVRNIEANWRFAMEMLLRTMGEE
jgi:DNA-binding GntR family transcriptional regulator